MKLAHPSPSTRARLLRRLKQRETFPTDMPYVASRRPPRTLAVDSSSALASAQEEGSVLTGVGYGPFASVLRTCVWLWAPQFLDKQWLWADCLLPLRTWPAMGRTLTIPNERCLWAVCFAFPTDMRWLWAVCLCPTFSFLDKRWLWADCLRPLHTWPAMGRSPLPDLDYSDFSDQETSGKGRPVSAIAFVKKWSGEP